MSEPVPGDTVVVDTNVLVAVGGPDNAKYQALRSFAIERDVKLLVPERVVAELHTMRAADRVEYAVEEGWATVVEPPEPTHTDAVAAMDYVRREIARRSGKDEHEVEKADTVLAGLAIEYLHRGDGTVFVVTDDRVAAAAIRGAVSSRGYDEGVSVLTRNDVVDDDDDIQMI
jgi:predicted nucleic acid-binding protein